MGNDYPVPYKRYLPVQATQTHFGLRELFDLLNRFILLRIKFLLLCMITLTMKHYRLTIAVFLVTVILYNSQIYVQQQSPSVQFVGEDIGVISEPSSDITPPPGEAGVAIVEEYVDEEDPALKDINDHAITGTKIKLYKDNITPKQFIEMYKKDAIANMRKSGIPASLTLAQGILESRSGNSSLARSNNNFFGIKCQLPLGKCKRGHCTNKEDDFHKDFFRKYKNAEKCFEDHAKFLRAERYTKHTRKLSRTDYKGWCRAIRKGGYATDKDYAEKLIGIIKAYELYKYDS